MFSNDLSEIKDSFGFQINFRECHAGELFITELQ